MRSKISTRQFGDLEFDEGLVYRFPDGVPGFEELRDFIIIDDKDTEPIKWLLSVEDPGIGFAILDASVFAPQVCEEIPGKRSDTAAVFVVVVLGRDPDTITANLRAPLILDNGAKTGRQLVLNTDRLSTRHKII